MMSQLELLALLVFLLAWLTSFYSGYSTSQAKPAELSYRAHYDKALSLQPLSTWLSGIAWTLVYGLNAGASFVYWRDGDPTSARYQSTLAIIIVSVLLSKIHAPLFLSVRAPLWAIVVLLVLAILGIVLLILSGLDALWLSTALFVPYELWLFVAVALHWRLYSDLQALRQDNANARQSQAQARISVPKTPTPKRVYFT